MPAQRCNECGAAEATTETLTGRQVCQRCANRLLGASAGTVLGGVQSGIVTGLTTEHFTGVVRRDLGELEDGHRKRRGHWLRRFFGS